MDDLWIKLTQARNNGIIDKKSADINKSSTSKILTMGVG
jgi:hypothetical protein